MAVEFNELSGAVSALTANVDKINKALSQSSQLIQKGFLDLDKNFAFIDKDIQKSFKGLSAYDKQLLQMSIALSDQRKVINESIDALEKIIDTTEDEQRKIDAQKQLALKKEEKLRLDSITAEDALKQKTIKDLRDTAIKTMANVADKFVQIYTKSFSQAYNKLSSAYEGVYGDVTSKGGYSRSAFNTLIKDLAVELKRTGLDKSISISDYTQQLQSIISSGMTGPLAGKVAKYGVIAQESGFSFGFSNQDFLKTLSQMDAAGQDIDAFLENIIASSKSVVEEVGNAYGFANSNFDTLITSLHNIASVTNMSEKAINSSMEAMVAFNGVMGITNIDTTKFYEELTQYATHGLSAVSDQSKIIFRSLGDDIRSEFESKGVGAALEKMMSGYYQLYNPSDQVEFINALSEQLNVRSEDVYSLYKSYGSSQEFQTAFENALNAAQGSSYEETVKKLGEYQTAEEALANTMETNTASLVMISQDGNIITKQILDTLVSYVGSFSLKDAVNLVSNTTNTLSNLTKGKSGELLTKLGSKFDAIGSVSAPGSMSKGTSMLFNAYDAGASGIGGKLGQANTALMTSKFGAVSKVSSFLGSTGGAVAGGVLGGALTLYDAVEGWNKGSVGGTKGLAGAGLGALTGVVGPVESGWDIAKAAGKNALKFGGIGTAIGGPVGTAVGAGLGAIVGLTGALIDYNDKQNVLNRSLTQMTENMDKVNDSLSIQQDNYKKSIELDELAQRAKKGDTEAIESLNAQYPQLLRYVDEQGNVTDKYSTVLDAVVESEKEKLAKESLESASTAFSASKTAFKASKVQKNFKTATENIAKFISESESGGPISDTTQQNYDTAMETLGMYYSSLLSPDLYAAYASLPKNANTLADITNNKSALETDFAMLTGLWNLDDTTFSAQFGETKDGLKAKYGEFTPKTLYDMYNSDVNFKYAPPFRTGIDYVPFDEFPAILHKGEKVMTSTEAALYRAKGPKSTAVNSDLMDVLQLQTNTIIDILNKIYTAMQGSTIKKSVSNFIDNVKPYTLPSNAY